MNPAKTILVVDDEQEVLDFLEKKLPEQGYNVLRAATAMEAIREARKNLPQLILMDIVLPDMEGSEAVRLLAEAPQTQDIPVIFLSGILSKDDMTDLELNVGGRLYKAVSKPFAFEDLLTEIKKTIG
ncbi:MAG: response regulator [Candidatus Omnitrophica bacterium]|nr:response regulator [Candidatus Omnitrophota bacterium]